MTEDEKRIASLRAELGDRATENRELRREIGRALRLVKDGNIDAATTLPQLLSRSATEK